MYHSEYHCVCNRYIISVYIFSGYIFYFSSENTIFVMMSQNEKFVMNDIKKYYCYHGNVDPVILFETRSHTGLFENIFCGLFHELWLFWEPQIWIYCLLPLGKAVPILCSPFVGLNLFYRKLCIHLINGKKFKCLERVNKK